MRAGMRNKEFCLPGLNHTHVSPVADLGGGGGGGGAGGSEPLSALEFKKIIADWLLQ